MHYIFIDYENVQPAHLTPLLDMPCKVLIFVGALQNKLPVTLVTQMQTLGNRAKFIQVSTSAKDALDFHIAYYVGKMAADDKDGYFHILSNDKGYDPLIEHLVSKNIKVQRKGFNAVTHSGVTVKAPVKPRPKLGTDEKIEKITQSLKKSQPTTEQKLHNFIKNQLPTSKDLEIQTLINCLRNKNIVAGKKSKISYPALAA